MRTRAETKVNPQAPATWLKPDEPLIGTDGRDWSWAYVWFKDVPKFPGYKAEAATGAVWSCRNHGTWKRLRPRIVGKPGNIYYVVALYLGAGVRVDRMISHVVLEAFVGPRVSGMEACHWPDPDTSDNSLSNLRWDTHKANAKDYAKWLEATGNSRPMNTRVGEANHFAKFSAADISRVLERIASGTSVPVAAKDAGICPSYVYTMLHGKVRTHDIDRSLLDSAASRVKSYRGRASENSEESGYVGHFVAPARS